MIGPGVSLNHHHNGRYWQLVGVGPDAEMRSRKTPDWGDDSQAMFFLAWRCRFAAGRDTTSQTWGQRRTPHQTPTPTTRPVSQLGCRLFCQISNALQEAVSSSVPPWWRFSYQHSRASHLDPSRRCRDLEVLEEGLEPHLIQGCHSDQSAPASTMPLSVSLTTTPVGDFLTLRGSSRLSTHSRRRYFGQPELSWWILPRERLVQDKLRYRPVGQSARSSQSQSCIWHPTRRWHPQPTQAYLHPSPAQSKPYQNRGRRPKNPQWPPCSQRVPKMHASLISSLSAAPGPICSPISCRKRDTVRGLGRGKRLWLDKPKSP